MRTIAQLLLTFLLNASWQVALIAAFAALCDWLLRGTAARYRHALWVCALLFSLCIPALSCLYLIEPLLISKQSTPEITSMPIVTTRIISPDVEPIETPASETRVTVEPVRRNFWMSPLRIDQKLTTVLVALYALFLLYRSTNFFRAWRRTRTIVSSAYEFRFLEPAQTIIQKCQSSIGVNRVRILCSALVPVPITVGIINPLVILPERLLHEVDVELLTSAVGHELVHVARRDYLANLIYEIISLPLSFHPAVALVRRRIKQTRELCCDESVATKLLRPEVYARSLVCLIGSVSITRRVAADTTIGIAESDNLEVRIMSLLRTPKFTPRRKTLLLIVASLLLVAPCLAATSFALTFDIGRQEPAPAPSQQASQQIERQDQERAREELKRQARELKEQTKVASRSAADEARLKEAREKLAETERRTLDLEARQREEQKSVTEMQKTGTDKKATVIYKVEPEYPDDARAKKIEGSVLLGFTIDHDGLPQGIQIKRSLDPSLDKAAVEAVRKWRFLPAMKDGQPVSMWILAEVHFGQENKRDQEQKERELVERAKIQDREKEERETKVKNIVDGQVVETRRSKEREEQGREERARKQAELTSGASISMDKAIQIATSKYPGKVLACSLGRDGDKIFYHVVIITPVQVRSNTKEGKVEAETTTATYVWVSAVDGQILKTEKE